MPPSAVTLEAATQIGYELAIVALQGGFLSGLTAYVLVWCVKAAFQVSRLFDGRN